MMNLFLCQRLKRVESQLVHQIITRPFSNSNLMVCRTLLPSQLSSFHNKAINRECRQFSLSVTDPFINRHIGPTNDDISEMLRTIGLSSLDELIDLTVPSSIRLDSTTQRDIHHEMRDLLNERRATEKLRSLASQNIVGKSFIGQGFVNCTTPAVLRRLVLENPGWYTVSSIKSKNVSMDIAFVRIYAI